MLGDKKEFLWAFSTKKILRSLPNCLSLGPYLPRATGKSPDIDLCLLVIALLHPHRI